MEELPAANLWIHTENDTATCREVTHYSAYEIVRNSDFKLHDWLEEARLCLYDTLLECEGCSNLEGCFVGVYIVVGTIVQNCLDVLALAACERALFHTFEETLFNSRYVLLWNGTAEELFGEFEFLLRR